MAIAAASDKTRELQRTLYRAAKADPRRRFHALHDKVHRKDVRERAWRQVRANRGAAGIERQTIEQVERYGVARLLDELEADLRTGDYRMLPARRAFIQKPGSGERRPLSIPAVRDRILQAAVKIVIEPIFEADFQPCSSQTRWILDAYPLAVAALLPLLLGAAGDRYGRRAAFTIGPFGFAAASVVGALASTPEQLIGARATLGAAGALIMPATLAHVRVLFTDPQAFRVPSPYR